MWAVSAAENSISRMSARPYEALALGHGERQRAELAPARRRRHLLDHGARRLQGRALRPRDGKRDRVRGRRPPAHLSREAARRKVLAARDGRATSPSSTPSVPNFIYYQTPGVYYSSYPWQDPDGSLFSLDFIYKLDRPLGPGRLDGHDLDAARHVSFPFEDRSPRGRQALDLVLPLGRARPLRRCDRHAGHLHARSRRVPLRHSQLSRPRRLLGPGRARWDSSIPAKSTPTSTSTLTVDQRRAGRPLDLPDDGGDERAHLRRAGPDSSQRAHRRRKRPARPGADLREQRQRALGHADRRGARPDLLRDERRFRRALSAAEGRRQGAVSHLRVGGALLLRSGPLVSNPGRHLESRDSRFHRGDEAPDVRPAPPARRVDRRILGRRDAAGAGRHASFAGGRRRHGHGLGRRSRRRADHLGRPRRHVRVVAHLPGRSRRRDAGLRRERRDGRLRAGHGRHGLSLRVSRHRAADDRGRPRHGGVHRHDLDRRRERRHRGPPTRTTGRADTASRARRSSTPSLSRRSPPRASSAR